LIRRNEAEIIRDVEAFYRQYNKYDRNGGVVRNDMDLVVPRAVMIRGALVGRDPRNNRTAATVNGMTDAEEAALAAEKEAGFGEFTWGLKAVILLTGMAAVIQQVSPRRASNQTRQPS
jgi:hypothetical protein